MADINEVIVRGSAAGFAQEILAGRHPLTADEPVAAGGADTGPTPYDLLLAALGAWTSMTVALYARRKSWPLEAVTVRLRHSKIHAADCADCETKEGMLDHIESDLEFAGRLTQEQRSKLLEIAEKCPVHRTLVSEIDTRSRVLWAMAHLRRITQQGSCGPRPMWLAGMSPRNSNFRVTNPTDEPITSGLPSQSPTVTNCELSRWPCYPSPAWMRNTSPRSWAYPTSPRALHGSRSWAGGSAGTRDRLRLSGQSGRANARSFFAKGRREAEAGVRTLRRSNLTEMKRPTRACGCRCGSTMLTRFTDTVWPPGWTSLSHRLTCLGTSERCTCGTRTGTCFGSVRALRTNKACVPRQYRQEIAMRHGILWKRLGTSQLPWSPEEQDVAVRIANLEAAQTVVCILKRCAECCAMITPSGGGVVISSANRGGASSR